MATETNSISNTQNRPKRRPNPQFLSHIQNNDENFLSSIMTLVTHTITMTKNDKRFLVYVDEMLHSIFFLGYIHKPTLDPEQLLKQQTLIQIARELFPGPFNNYKTHLPFRTPFSILLDMMQIIYDTEEQLLTELPLLLTKLGFPPSLSKAGNKYEQFYTLESTVICVCYSDSNPKRYYGASLSCRKGNSKRIMIDISCLKMWHKFVSHAVMSFYPTGSGDSITFPESVKCQAYIRDQQVYKRKPACLNCKQLFNLRDADIDKVTHPYGNCAETECLSKLLSNDQNIQEKTQIENHTNKKLQTLKDSTTARLIKELRLHKISRLLFYSPMQ